MNGGDCGVVWFSSGGGWICAINGGAWIFAVNGDGD